MSCKRIGVQKIPNGMRYTYLVCMPKFTPERLGPPLTEDEKRAMNEEYTIAKERAAKRRVASVSLANSTILRYVEGHPTSPRKPLCVPGSAFDVLEIPISIVTANKFIKNEAESVRFLKKAIDMLMEQNIGEQAPLYAQRDNDKEITEHPVAYIISTSETVNGLTAVIKFKTGKCSDKHSIARWVHVHKNPVIDLEIDDDANVGRFYLAGTRFRDPDLPTVYKNGKSGEKYGEYYSDKLGLVMRRIEEEEALITRYENKIADLKEYLYRYLGKDAELTGSAMRQFIKTTDYGDPVKEKISSHFLDFLDVQKELTKARNSYNSYIKERDKILEDYDPEKDLKYIEVFD